MPPGVPSLLARALADQDCRLRDAGRDLHDNVAMNEAGRTHRHLAVAVWVSSWSLCAAAVILLVLADTPAEGLPFYSSGVFWGLDLLVGLLNGPASAVILMRSRHVVGLLSALVAVGFSAAAFSYSYAAWAVGVGAPAAGFAAHGFAWTWLPGAVAATISMPWLLRDDRPSALGRTLAGTGLVVALTAGGLMALVQQTDSLANPLAPASASAQELIVGGYQVTMMVAAALGVVAVAGVATRWRRENGSGRRRLAAVVLALTALLVSFTLLQFAPGTIEQSTLKQVMVVVLFASQVLLPVSVIVLVLRERMWGVDVAVSRTTSWLLLTSAVVALYLVLVWVVGGLLPWQDRIAGVVAAAVLALAVQPVRRWLQIRVDRLVYGTQADPGTLLARLGEPRGDGSSHLQVLVHGLRRALRLSHVEVVSVDGSVVASTGAVVESLDAEYPLVLDGRERGRLRVAARPGERLDLRTRSAIEPSTGVLAVALDLAEVNTRLERATVRLGEVRHEERRALRRELHDGLGPAMAGVGLGIAAARRRLQHDATGADDLLADLEDEVARRTDDVRQVARSLLPPALDDGDLVSALEVLAGRFHDLAVDLRIDVGDGLDTRRQVAVYHVVAESLLNAHRHAGATRVTLVLRREGDGVVVEVQDDGIGRSGDTVPGIGTSSMRERAEELGGELSIVGGDPSGTRVRMRLP